MMAVNGVKEVNGSADRIYYELDGEGDADSSTTPSHNVDHRDRKCHIDFYLINFLFFFLFFCLSLVSSNHLAVR